MILDVEASTIISLMTGSGREDYWTCTPDRARTLTTLPREAVPSGISVVDAQARLAERDVALRVYRPSGVIDPPTVIFFHGGGWVLGDLDSYDGLVGRLALESGCAWVSVDYRKAPESPFPAAFDDAHDVTQWLLADTTLGLNVRRWALAGDSAGANLAATVSIARRDHGHEPASLMLLVYPVLDTVTDTDCFTENDGYLLPADAMRWHLDQYLPNPADREDRRVAALRVDDLTGLPHAIVVAAGFDVLRDQAIHFAKRLRAAGGAVDLIVEGTMPHAFWTLPITGARRSVAEVGGRIGEILASATQSVGGP